MAYKLSPAGIKFTEQHEGVIPYIYDDSVSPTKMWLPHQRVGGHLTAGVGHLVTPDEIKQWSGKTIPQPVIDAWFDADNNAAEATVSRLVKVHLSPNQADVLIDFEFNAGALAKSTLLKTVNDGRFSEVPDQLMRWTKTHINGKLVESSGLRRRCEDRVDMWNRGRPSAPLGVPKASNVPVPSPAKTSTFEWATLGVSGFSGLSGLSGIGGFLGIAIGVVLIGAFLIGAGIILKRQFFPT